MMLISVLEKPGAKRFLAIYAMLFFFSAQVSLALYTNSSFLSSILNTFSLTKHFPHEAHEGIVGLVYALNAIIAFFTLLHFPRLLKNYGNFRVTRGLLFLSATSLLVLAWSPTVYLIIPAFILQSVMVSSLYLVFDIFLEKYSKEQSVGLVRGAALTVGGLAFMFPPKISGMIASQGDFTPIYFWGALLLLPPILILIKNLKDFEDPDYHILSLGATCAEIKADRDIRGILCIQFLLQFFYAWMIIYLPLYLAEHLGLSWMTIGSAIVIALSAFVLFEIPAGEIADKWLGEKELLVVGLLLMILSSSIIPFITSTTLLVWGGILFVGRMGASIVETMTETYFFKLVGPERANLVSAFRLTTPVAFLIAPSLAAILLGIMETGFLFGVLAFILLWGGVIVVRLKDTR